MKKNMLMKKSLSLFVAILMMFAVIVPASALFDDDGNAILFYTGSGADDSMSYKSLKYSHYGTEIASGSAAPAVAIGGGASLADTWTARLGEKSAPGSVEAEWADTLRAAIVAGDAQWIWSTASIPTTGVLIGNGAANPSIMGDIVRFDKTFTFAADSVPGHAELYIAADNGYIVFINGELLCFSKYLFDGVDRADVKTAIEAEVALNGIDGVANLFEDLCQDEVTTDDWQNVAKISIPADMFIADGENTITVIGFNEEMGVADHGFEGTPYLNPAGIVFTLEVPYSPVPGGEVNVVKMDVAGRVLRDEVFHFVAYTEIDSKGKPVAASKYSEKDTQDGYAHFGKMAPGTYYIFEELSDVRNQKGRFKPFNQHSTPGRYFEFVIVVVEANQTQDIEVVFVNDYSRTKVDVTKTVGFKPESAALSFGENYPIDEWQCAYRITKQELAGPVNFDVDVVLGDEFNDTLVVGNLNIQKKADGGLYGLFTPNTRCPALAPDVYVSIETDENMFSSDDIIAGTEFLIADADALDDLFDPGEDIAYIYINGDVASAKLITIPSSETFYLLFEGPAFQAPAVAPNGDPILDTDGDPVKGTVYAIKANSSLDPSLALFWGTYTVTEINADGTPVTGYKAKIKTTVVSKGDGDEYGAPEIRYDGTFTIYRLCDKVKVEVFNTPF